MLEASCIYELMISPYTATFPIEQQFQIFAIQVIVEAPQIFDPFLNIINVHEDVGYQVFDHYL